MGSRSTSSALVTGAGRGVGRTMAIALARAGHNVALVARTVSQLNETRSMIESFGVQVRVFPGDVTDELFVQRTVAETEGALGGIDFLVNNAGHAGAIGPVWEVDSEQWWRTFDVNLRGVFLFTRAVLPAMIARTSGRIVNVASGAALRPTPFSTSYGASKAAVIQFSESVAHSVIEHGVRVFSITPGFVRTAMTQELIDSPTGQQWLPHFKNAPPEAWTHPEQCGVLITRIASGDADALWGTFINANEDLDERISKLTHAL